MSMRSTHRGRILVGAAMPALFGAAIWVACATAAKPGPIQPGPGAQKRILEAMILAQPGDVIEIGEGTFEIDTTLSLDVDGVTIRGQGMDKTVFDFAKQAAGGGGEGFMVTANDFTIEDLAVHSTSGDAIKTEGVSGVTFRRVRVDWPGPPSTYNGAYGLYPVQSQNVLIEDSEVRGASDAGIYVGQSKNIIVRRNKAWENVAGIEIENSQDADVYENEAWNNSGGLLVFSLPELPVKEGRNARVFANVIRDNNHPNFGRPGSIVAALPPGSGLLIMANDNVEVFENEFRNNDTANVSIVSFLITQRQYDDPGYDPYPEGVWVHGNTFEGGGTNAVGQFAEAVRPLHGEQMPDIVWDGIVDAAKLVDGKLPPELRIYIGDNGDADFANFDFGKVLAGSKPMIDTDLARYQGALPSPPAPVVIEGVESMPASVPASAESTG
jgi:parallel beta-helix repeat protein